ncbi:MAG: hypothetical protein GX631_07670 [Dehalococcoidales bacterium]|nr:hypothetical protein [Dehalococcoidales bacterium]
MNRQLYWEDIENDTEIPPLPKIATTMMLVKWAGASGDFNPLHYDSDFARSAGMDSPIVHGALKRQWLIQMITDWIGDEGTLQSFSCRYRAIDYPRSMKTMTESHDGETWTCRGVVQKKYDENGRHLADCRIWLENGAGKITTDGKATVVLPSRE